MAKFMMYKFLLNDWRILIKMHLNSSKPQFITGHFSQNVIEMNLCSFPVVISVIFLNFIRKL